MTFGDFLLELAQHPQILTWAWSTIEMLSLKTTFQMLTKLVIFQKIMQKQAI